MNARETVQALQKAIQAGDFKKAKTYLSDDFRFSGPVPEPVNGDQWMGMSESIKRAFPDIDYHFTVNGADANVVHISAQLSGKNTGDFDLSAMDMGLIPATGKSFSATKENGDVTVRGDKVVSWAGQPIEGAGLEAILLQLGIEMPAQ